MSVAERHRWGSAPEFVGPRHELRERLLLDLFLAAAPGPRVLNAGAGQGTFSRLLEERGFEVVSSDASADCVGHLRSLGGSAVQARLDALPFPDASFDAAVLGEVLEHVEDDRAGLREVARVLRPDGVVVISVPANPAAFAWADDWAGHFRRYSREAIGDLCAAAGLTVQTCVGWGFPVATLYHRHLYERRLKKVGSAPLRRWQQPALWALRGALQVDRLFVGVERGALGFLVVAARARG